MFENVDDPLWEGSRNTWMCKELLDAGEDVLSALQRSTHTKLSREDRMMLAAVLQWAADEFNTSYHADSMEGSYLEINRRVQVDVCARMHRVRPGDTLTFNLTESKVILNALIRIWENSEAEIAGPLKDLQEIFEKVEKVLIERRARSVFEFYS